MGILFCFRSHSCNEEDIIMMDPGPMNYGKMIMALSDRLNGLIGNYNHLKTEMDHMSLSIKELEEENKKLLDEIELLKGSDINGQTKPARKVRKGAK
jgi:hypothetical protein